MFFFVYVGHLFKVRQEYRFYQIGDDPSLNKDAMEMHFAPLQSRTVRLHPTVSHNETLSKLNNLLIFMTELVRGQNPSDIRQVMLVHWIRKG